MYKLMKGIGIVRLRYVWTSAKRRSRSEGDAVSELYDLHFCL